LGWNTLIASEGDIMIYSMRACLLTLGMGTLFMVASITSLAAEPANPEVVIQTQLDAYNAHDIHAFMATYADDAEIYEYPAKLLMKGANQIADFYANKRFNDAKLKATLAKRIVMGDVVVDHEQIVLTFPEGPGQLEVIAIYEVRAGKIEKVTLLRGKKSLDSAASQ
jgi:hypothetical protein